MKHLFLILALVFISCAENPSTNSESIETSDQFNFLQQIMDEEVQNPLKTAPQCPKGHVDSIVPIVYGFPSEEMFAQSDSGLIMLGGCEMGKERYYCKIHDIAF